MNNRHLFEIWGITQNSVKFNDTVHLNSNNERDAIIELKSIGIDKNKHIDFGIRKVKVL